jgi:hypothetical protein
MTVTHTETAQEAALRVAADLCHRILTPVRQSFAQLMQVVDDLHYDLPDSYVVDLDAPASRLRPRTPQGVLWLTDSDEPTVVVQRDGSVMVHLSVECSLAFVTVDVFERWLSDVVRGSVNP